jgi:hypothetical protein
MKKQKALIYMPANKKPNVAELININKLTFDMHSNNIGSGGTLK